jgi:hypothetical protein
MPRRPAATLMEILVSIFLMGIGLLAILALFPLGAFRMAQAIQQDRAGHLAHNGFAVAQTFDVRNDPNVTALVITPTGLVDAFGNQITAHPDYPGFPVFVDPVGAKTYVGAAANLVGGRPGITRSDVAALQGDPRAYLRWFTLTDDLQFDNTGVPTLPVQREGALSFALMFRRPRSSVANVVEMSVVVFARRPLSPGNDFSSYESPYPATFAPASNQVVLNSNGLAKPALRPGSWILDGTVNTPIAGQPFGYANGYFYRVVSVTEDPNNSDLLQVEVATPLRGNWPNVGGVLTGTVIVMDNVVEVLEKGPGW